MYSCIHVLYVAVFVLLVADVFDTTIQVLDKLFVLIHIVLNFHVRFLLFGSVDTMS
jgi:hypothetical protein